MFLHAVLLFLAVSASAAPLHTPQLAGRNPAEGPLLAVRAAEPAPGDGGSAASSSGDTKWKRSPQDTDATALANLLSGLQDSNNMKNGGGLDRPADNSNINNMMSNMFTLNNADGMPGNPANANMATVMDSMNQGPGTASSDSGNEPSADSGSDPNDGGSWANHDGGNDDGNSGANSAPGDDGSGGSDADSSAWKRDAAPQFGSGWGRPGWHRGSKPKRDAAPQFGNGPSGPPRWHQQDRAEGANNDGPAGEEHKREAAPQFGGGWGRPGWERPTKPKKPKREAEPQFGSGPGGPPSWYHHDGANGKKGQ